MATIDIGKIKPVFRGTYDNSTAYVLDDIVYYNGSSYVAKTSTTGNLPTDTTKWNILASGSGGIWSSTLGIGTAGQVVKVNSGATALEFANDDGGTIKSMNYTIYGQQQVVGGVTNDNSKFTNLAVTVTPQSASSKFLLSATINGETHNDPWDYVFNFIRTVGGSDTDIGDLLHTTSHSGLQGISAVPTSYASSSTNNDSTPEGATFQVVDAPNTTSAITYVPTFMGDGSNFSLNKTVGGGGNEAFVSTMYVMEF